MPHARHRNGFTIVELLVVIVIIAVLIALLLPALRQAKRASKVSLCMSNLKQYALGMTTYATEDRQGRYRYIWNGTPQWWANGWGGATIVWLAPAGQDESWYLGSYLEFEGGGNMSGDIFWCPLAEPIVRPPWNQPPHPQYGEAFWYHTGVWLGSAVGYSRYAGMFMNGDYTNSGNISDSPIVEPATSSDVILSDRITSEAGGYLDTHADNPWDYRMHRDVNVAYSDGHVETHGHRVTQTSPTPRWTDHYIIQNPWATHYLY